jgi:hypothetical protein
MIEDFRDDFLKPLARVIRENNINLDGLVGLIKTTVFNVFGPGGLNILKELDGLGGLCVGDVSFMFLNAARTQEVSVFQARNAEINFKIGKTFSFAAREIKFDIGIPALGLEAAFTPRITIDFELAFGFGVSLDKGFYFVTDDPLQPGDQPEMALNVAVTFSGVSCPAGTVDRANVEGRLLFLALKITDGVDIDGDGKIDVTCTPGTPSYPSPQTTPQKEPPRQQRRE